MTKNDLLERLLSEKIPTDTYSLNGGLPNEVYCLSIKGDNWEIYYSERGQQSELKCFRAENEACEYFYKLLSEVNVKQVKTNDKETLKWIECDGGPHILMEKRLIESWKGPDCELHYEKACEIEDYVEMIAIADGYGVVISEDIWKSTWLAEKDDNGGSLIILNYVNDNVDGSTIINRSQK